ncbi:DNA-binding protein [Vibrio pectenicida]|uniref:DNA-binding protein n=1 Tax=Vibrio pectenicida TaxID=62763 RepID=A0A3R9FLC9_9VIBR|nr:DNA-binding protein [Vibrio pectenicida]RSD30708.1 DNA-binding protein [Vibrio pectenicida]
MLALDGVPVNLDSMKVEMSMELKDQDMSGQSSGTDTAEQGDKGKKLTFSGRVPFTHVETLTQLYSLASDKDETNTRKVYRIGNDIALALKIRNVKFTGRINAREHETLQAWNVSFELREHNSVAEQKEQRAKEKTKPEQRENTRLKQALNNAEEATQ